GSDQDFELSTITYTGTWSNGTCSFTPDARKVSFSYELRPDTRTTYRYGVGVISGTRLASITTFVGTTPVRTYKLSYHQSAATRRSILDSMALCSGGSCDTASLQLPVTTFSYQEDTTSFDFWHAVEPTINNGQPLGPDMRMPLVPDLDGDGTRDLLFLSDSGTRTLRLSSCSTAISTAGIPAPVWLGQDRWPDNAGLEGASDVDYDGRADIWANQGGYLAFYKADCNSQTLSLKSTTNLPLPVSPASGSVSGVDYDGNGLADTHSVDSAGNETIVLHRIADPTNWSSSVIMTVSGPPKPPPNNGIY